MVARPKVVGAWRHLLQSFRLVAAHWQFFVIFVIVYALLSFVFVHNFANDVDSVKSGLSTSLGNNQALTAVGTYSLLLTTSTSGASSSTAAYQYFLFIVASLAVIWALRRFMSTDQQHPGVKASYYEGMYPLIQFILVSALLTVDLLPFAGTAGLYALVVSNGVAVTVIEQLLWLVFFAVGAVISLWLLTRTLFALYIVTLPGALPKQSIKDSWRITKPYQFNVARKLLLLVVVIVVMGALLMVPIIAFAASLTSPALFIFSALVLPFLHVYLYSAYRELLHE